MTSYESFVVDKSSGTFADVLTAYGLARVVRQLLEVQEGAYAGADVRLRDEGPIYRLRCSMPLREDTLAQVEPPLLPGHAKVIQTKKNAAKLPEGLGSFVVDYDTERDKRSEYFDVWNKLSGEAKRAAMQNQNHPELHRLPESPHPDWNIFRAVNPMALIGYNNLLLDWWAVQDDLPDALRLLFALYADSPNDVEGIRSQWRKLGKERQWEVKHDATAQQLFNPDQGKGQNRTKANCLRMDNIKSFWLPELLKIIGFYEAAQTRALRGSKDRKTYVLAPIEIELEDHVQVMSAFQGMITSETSTRSDILAALYYTRAMLEYVEDQQTSGLAALVLSRQTPRKVIAGFHTAFYKNLGNASATMNLAFINLPGWVIIRSVDDLPVYRRVLEEHTRLVRQFDESHSDAFTLLQHYRDFVSGDDLTAFFHFTNAYAAYLIGRRERNRPTMQLRTDNLRRLIVGTDLKLAPILENVGFQNIAYAIRQSTVIAQYRKKQGDRRYAVRYGLGQDLTRKSNYADEFVTALSDFLHKYNAENAQVMENRQGPYRRSIRTSDIDEIVRLIDEYSSQTICNLLVAYGYARDPRVENSTEEDKE